MESSTRAEFQGTMMGKTLRITMIRGRSCCWKADLCDLYCAKWKDYHITVGKTEVRRNSKGFKTKESNWISKEDVFWISLNARNYPKSTVTPWKRCSSQENCSISFGSLVKRQVLILSEWSQKSTSWSPSYGTQARIIRQQATGSKRKAQRGPQVFNQHFFLGTSTLVFLTHSQPGTCLKSQECLPL